MSVLDVKNVSVRYLTGDLKGIGLKEYILRRLKNDYHVSEFWANRNISFSLEQGDMLGIIGTNGAGKSTLLKVLSGTMKPSEGTVVRSGKVAALLELGGGFDRDLTVRENTYLRGAMLGYTRKFIDESYDAIIDFSELREYQDRPFKQLSSGMKSRLAFSIASLVQPDILILDEVLAVGDGAFRHKSEAKMKEVINGGATTILVSHSIAQVRKLCNKVLWLHKGEQVEFGDDVQGICDRYQNSLMVGLSGENVDIIQYNREKTIAAIMKKTGWAYEHTKEQIETARKRFGITYAPYGSQGVHYVPPEQQGSHFAQLLETIAKNRERCIAATMEATGWTKEQAEAHLTETRQRLDILFRDYVRYEFYRVPTEQQEELYCRILVHQEKG